MVTWRGHKDSLSGKGTVDMLIAMLDFKEYLFNKVVPNLIAQIEQKQFYHGFQFAVLSLGFCG